jgi:predicted Fe-S protein YdhL (DUF1289 family)
MRDSSGESASSRLAGGLKSPADSMSSIQRSARIEDMSSLKVSDSPCVAVCSTLYDDICRGCGRTAMEVANWVFLSEDEKREIWIRIRSQGYPRRNNR